MSVTLLSNKLAAKLGACGFERCATMLPTDGYRAYLWSELGASRALSTDRSLLSDIKRVSEEVIPGDCVIAINQGRIMGQLRAVLSGPFPNIHLTVTVPNEGDARDKRDTEELCFVKEHRAVHITICHASAVSPPQMTQKKRQEQAWRWAFLAANLRSCFAWLMHLFGIRLVFRVIKFVRKDGVISCVFTKIVRLCWPLLMCTPMKALLTDWRFQKMSREQFLECGVMDANPLNKLVRQAHFDVFQLGEDQLTVGHIVRSVSDQRKWTSIMDHAVQPERRTLNNFPLHLNLDFWSNGNSYFLNVLRAGFREGVIAYEDRKLWESLTSVPFSYDYYSHCKPMEEGAIARLLKDKPLTIRKGALASGRHRVFAMIGRLARGEAYIPIYIDRLV